MEIKSEKMYTPTHCMIERQTNQQQLTMWITYFVVKTAISKSIGSSAHANAFYFLRTFCYL